MLIAPPDLRLADAQLAIDIYHGRFVLGGYLVDTGGRSPFQEEDAKPSWFEALHGFRWLRHMRESGTDLSAANARALVADWIATHGRKISGPAWAPHVTSRRIIAWLQHSTVVLQGAELAFYRAFLKSLAIQIRYLRSMVREMDDGEERLRARIALAFAALSLPAPQSTLRNATRNLANELRRQILADGGHVSRNPVAILELLADLLPLRQTYASQAEKPPSTLIGAVERMLPALRFFRHQEGSMSRFNGMGYTLQDRVAAILRHDDTAGQPLMHMPHSGYQRLAMGGTTVIADVGAPPPPNLSHQAHAGCLSFEMSSGHRHFVVNCGVDEFGAADFRLLSRATAAHSTATLNDSSSARFAHPGNMNGLLGTPMIGGPRLIECRRSDEPAGVQGFVARHDGYLTRFGLYHEREIGLSAGGSILEGTDRFYRAGGQPPTDNRRDAIAIRFHLHPDIELYHDEEDRLLLSARHADQWVFACDEVEAAVEESIFFAGLGGPRRSRQIVLSFSGHDVPEANWRFTRIKSTEA